MRAERDDLLKVISEGQCAARCEKQALVEELRLSDEQLAAATLAMSEEQRGAATLTPGTGVGQGFTHATNWFNFRAIPACDGYIEASSEHTDTLITNSHITANTMSTATTKFVDDAGTRATSKLPQDIMDVPHRASPCQGWPCTERA